MYDDVKIISDFVERTNKTIKSYDKATSDKALNIIKKIKLNVDKVKGEAKLLSELAFKYSQLTYKVNKHEDTFTPIAIFSKRKYNKNIGSMLVINNKKNNIFNTVMGLQQSIFADENKLKSIIKKQFKNVNIVDYVKENYNKNDIIKAYKYKIVKARVGKVGEKIKTVMSNGLVETINTVKSDDKTGKNDWVITNVEGEQYVIPHKTFEKKYNQLPNNDGYYQPKGELVSVVKLKDNITFKASWKEDMKIEKGGFLVVSNPDDIYGIKKEAFFNTYKIKEVENIEEPSDER